MNNITKKINYLLDQKRFYIENEIIYLKGIKSDTEIAYLNNSCNSICLVIGINIQFSYDELVYIEMTEKLITLKPRYLNDFCQQFCTNLDSSFDILESY